MLETYYVVEESVVRWWAWVDGIFFTKVVM